MADIAQAYSEDGFHRQRRNLIVGSIVLLFIHVADVRLGTQGSIFGLPAHIGKPGTVDWFLFVGVVYWAIRFYQYHRQREGPSELFVAARKAMLKFLTPHALSCIEGGGKTEQPRVPGAQRIEAHPFQFNIVKFERDRIEGTVRKSWTIIKQDGSRQIDTGAKEYATVFCGRLLWGVRLRSYVGAVLNTPTFTEYILPYILFAVSIGYATYRLLAANAR